MKKSVWLAAAALMFASSAFAQLTTRENDAINPQLGARPQSGDAALTFNVPLGAGDSSSINLNHTLGTGEVLTFKYYNTNDVAYRFGIRLFTDRRTSMGTVADSNNVTPHSDPEAELFRRSSTREYIIVPGIEKHFSNSNFFDVYVGGDLYLGLGRDVQHMETTFSNDDFQNIKSSTPTSTLGLGGVVGFNVFLAQLPVSIGLEYGLNGVWVFGGKTKVEIDESIGGTTRSGEFYTANDNAFGNPDTRFYSDYKSRDFNMNTNSSVRIVFNIYFGAN